MTDNRDYFHKLVELMDVLRGPGGCPWDIEQTPETLMPMLIEEAYEVLEALDSKDPDDICEELGDLLFQVIFQARIAKEAGSFDAYEVCRRVYEKMVGRHPHIFGDATFEDADALLKAWEDIKAKEKAASGRAEHKESLLDGIPEKLPSIYKAQQMTEKAARVGFDWPDLEGIFDKLGEELDELREAVSNGQATRIKEEVGDIIFTAINVARFLSVDPETALRRANLKFLRRFQAMEEYFKQNGQGLKKTDLDEMEAFWQSFKVTEATNEKLTDEQLGKVKKHG